MASRLLTLLHAPCVACLAVACSAARDGALSSPSGESSDAGASAAPAPPQGSGDDSGPSGATPGPGDAGGGDGAGDGAAAAEAGPVDDAGDGGAGSSLGLDPPMGWSSWSFLRRAPDEARVRAQAQAIHDNKLDAHGYVYVNIDDFYYLSPKTTTDANGRWVVDAARFPSGMAAMGAFLHGLGLKFGMYVTPGIPVAAVTNNTPIEGTTAHAADVAVTTTLERNYNFGGSMYYIDYSKPGAQEFIDSWAKLLASYGVDYLKIDGVGAADIPDVQAWSKALKSSGRKIHLELSNNLPIADATTWQSLANGWRIEGDVECYCSATSYPLTSWAKVSARFGAAANWAPYSAPNARNDLDSLELGNGQNDGLSIDERRSAMSLWALAAAPLILGSDLTSLDAADVPLMTNDEVIAVGQAGVAAKRVTAGNLEVWSAREPDGSYAVGLFNLTAAAAPIAVTWASLGISGTPHVRDLWAHTDLGALPVSYQANVASHGAALVRVTP